MNALILVDIQQDFCKGGALAVPNGDTVVPIANKLMDSGRFDIVVATQDWHPANHKSFRVNNNIPAEEISGMLNGVEQVWWPEHCVNGTSGANFHSDLNLNKVSAIFRKGMSPNVDSYSGFFDNISIVNGLPHREATGLSSYLFARGALNVFIVGLATDYCVKYTAIDSNEIGFKTHVILDGCKAVNINVDDEKLATIEMADAGINIIRSGLFLT